MEITVTREHEICCGHRVVGHEGKCRNLHGHGYVFEFTVAAPELDSIGRVIDFSVIKSGLCQWLEDHWDHKTLLWENDPQALQLKELLPDSIVIVPFNPTAENIGKFLLWTIGRIVLRPPLRLVTVKVHETRKCSATVSGSSEG